MSPPERRAWEVRLGADGPTVVLAELRPSEMVKALRAAGRNADDFALRLEFVRHSLRRVGEREVGYPDVAGRHLLRHLPRTRHLLAAMNAWSRLHEPSTEALDALRASMSCEVDEDGVERWHLVLPEGRSVVLAEQPVESVGDVLAAAREAASGSAARAFGSALEAIRRSVVSVDGQPVDSASLDGAGWDRMFSVPETLLLAHAWAEIHGALEVPEVGEPKLVSGTS